MKLYKLYLSDHTTQDVLALRLEQAINCARATVVGYVVKPVEGEG